MDLKEKLKEWYPVLYPEMKKPYFLPMINKVLSKGGVLCPSPENIFKAYELCPPQKVKVVILGLDPYINGEAHGLSFSCISGKVPPSLRIIFNEIHRSSPNGLKDFRRSDACLYDWAMQGVLLLNTVLTTEKGKTFAHGHYGWQSFTKSTLEYLLNSPKPIVFLLWGEDAKKSLAGLNIPENKLILRSCHPAAELRGRLKFVGNNHFVEANNFLRSKGEAPIIWHI